jgi:hypothetical protein
MAADTCWTSLKPASRASVSISVGVKKLMKGVPLALVFALEEDVSQLQLSEID